MLDKFYVKNFKAFNEAEIRIKPITLIVGPNNSGKSSLIQAINIIQQTLLKNPNNYIFNTSISDGLREQTIDAGSFTEIVNNSAIDKNIEFKLYFAENYVEFSLKEDGDTNVYVSDFQCIAGELQYALKNLSLDDYNQNDLNIRNLNKFHITLDKIFKDSDILKLEPNLQIFREGFFFNIASATPCEQSLMNFYRTKISEQTRENKLNSEDKDDSAVNSIIDDMVKSIESYNRIPRISYAIFQKLKKDLSNIRYIGPIRKAAERSYAVGSTKDLDFCGEYAPQILSQDLDLKNKVESYFKKMGIAENIQIFIRNENQRSFEFKIKTACSDRGVNFKDVGCGTSQVLPIVVQSLMPKDQSLVILEQPEVHLHPSTQAELADFFTEIASNDHRFLIETHSDYFIERLRYNIATKRLKSEDVVIYYIEPNLTTKGSELIEIKINSEGQYINLPKGYITNFRLTEIKNMADIVLENLSRKANKPVKK